MSLLFLRIILGLVALICFLGGTNIMLKGAMHYLPIGTPTQPVLDNLLRFLSGIYFGCGFLLAFAAYRPAAMGSAIPLLGVVVLFSGLGRLYSRRKLGPAGNYLMFAMLLELVLGMAIIILSLNMAPGATALLSYAAFSVLA